MTKLRVLFNTMEASNPQEIIPKVKSLGIESISVFGEINGKELPPHFQAIAKEFKNINVNLFHLPTYHNETNWPESLKKDSAITIASLAQLSIHNYAWMIEGNLYGFRWNPLLVRYIRSDRLVGHFNAFYEIAHQINKNANVIVVPYPHPLMNLNCGIHGWKDWWIKYGEKLKFDSLALDAHIGVWIYALTKKGIRKRLVNPINFLKERGYSVSYVEVGYPTHGFKPLAGWYGWGREKDQLELLKISYQVLNDLEVPYMQICEFIDPDPKKQIYETFFGKKGQVPKFLGFIPVNEEKHFGLLKKDRSEKQACTWVRSITKSLNLK